MSETPGNGMINWYEDFFGADYVKVDIQPDTGAEVDFLVDVLECTPDTRMLDVCCGYGRHLELLAARGVNVYGCDLSPQLLGEAAGRLRERGSEAGRLVRCDARELPFSGVFDCASMMYTSLGYFDAEDDNFRVLASVAEALKPGGRFLIETVNRDYYVRTFSSRDWYEQDDVKILEKKSFDHMRNRSEIDVTVIDDAGERTYHHSIRLYALTELSMLLEAAGFEVEAVWGGFRGEAFDWNAGRMIILARVIV